MSSSDSDTIMGCYRSLRSDLEDMVEHATLYNEDCWSELFRALRLYLGSPVRRTYTTSLAPPPPVCIRLRLYSADKRYMGRVLDQADFRLEPNGDLDVDAVRAHWGVNIIRPCDRATGMIFAPARDDRWSALALHNLTSGKVNKLSVIYVPSADDEFQRHPSMRTTVRRACRQIVYDPGWYMWLLLALCIICTIAPYIVQAVALGLYVGAAISMLLLRPVWWGLMATYRSARS